MSTPLTPSLVPIATPAPAGLSKVLTYAYGGFAYLVGFGGLAYAMGFLNGIVVPVTLDGGAPPAAGVAFAVNLSLVLLFGIQHSVMARPRFKAWLTRAIPAWAERSTYALFSGLALIVVYLGWQPLPEMLWQAEAPALRAALYGVQVLGWVLLVASTFMLGHFELFGLLQVHNHAAGKHAVPPRFRTPGVYRFVRHPIQLGVLIAFWATPDMTVGHLLFASAFTVYIVIALKCFEEPALIEEYPVAYPAYMARVPMLLPRPRRRAGSFAQLL